VILFWFRLSGLRELHPIVIMDHFARSTHVPRKRKIVRRLGVVVAGLVVCRYVFNIRSLGGDGP
jgi:hypothetical protein